jgi:hypothetical protein
MESVRTKLIERGSRVESYAGVHYRAYHGIGWRLDHHSQFVKFSVKGRIVLDARGWDQFNPNASIIVTSL